MSIISIVGHKMRNTVGRKTPCGNPCLRHKLTYTLHCSGIAAEVFDALAAAKINITLISQGASEISISSATLADICSLTQEVD